MIRALLDTNVLLDFLLDREPFVEKAIAIWRANEAGRFEGYIAAITPVNIFYIANRLKGAQIARRVVADVLSSWNVCSLDKQTLYLAQDLPFRDYEDAVQHASAELWQLDFIITRNLKDFSEATMPVLDPDAFLEILSSQ